jgi:hypothetical protein
VELSDWIQLAAAVATAIAAIAAWRAARAAKVTADATQAGVGATREIAGATQEAARQAGIGSLVGMHADRLKALRDLHYRISWVTEGGPDRVHRPRWEQRAIKFGIPPGTTIVEGYALRGIIASTGLPLPNCLAVAEEMRRGRYSGAPVAKAEAELRAAMEAENRALDELGAALATR